MTEPKAKRPRRKAADVPEALAAWFSREDPQPHCWYGLVSPFRPLLAGWWAVWSASHPGSPPREGYEWLLDADSPEQPKAADVAAARAALRRLN